MRDCVSDGSAKYSSYVRADCADAGAFEGAHSGSFYRAEHSTATTHTSAGSVTYSPANSPSSTGPRAGADSNTDQASISCSDQGAYTPSIRRSDQGAYTHAHPGKLCQSTKHY